MGSLEIAESEAASAKALARSLELREKEAQQSAAAAAFGVRAAKKHRDRADRAERAATSAKIVAHTELVKQRQRVEAVENPLGIRMMMAELIMAAATPEGANQVV